MCICVYIDIQDTTRKYIEVMLSNVKHVCRNFN